jgi:hypothetical protein
MEMSMARYPGVYSESGAYIFAPYTQDVPMKLKVLDAFFIEGEI